MPDASKVDLNGQDPATRGQPWFIVPDLDFLPSPYSFGFLLICDDVSWGGKENPKGGATAFRVQKKDLDRFSSFLHDMFDVVDTQQPGGQQLHCGENSEDVALVLCASLKPDHAKLRNKLSQALSLAIKWGMSEAKHNLFWRLIALLAEVTVPLSCRDNRDVVPFFAQATLAGTAPMSVAMRLWRTRAKHNTIGYLFGPIKLPPHVYMELGPDLGATFMQSILTLVDEKVLLKSW